MFVFVCFVEEEENDLQNRSLTPYPFVCPEFWQHYNYLKEFHDRHTGAVHLPQLPLQSDITPANSAYVAHVLNTIDEEEAAEDDKLYKTAEATSDGKPNASYSECEVTVTITLPAKKDEAMTRRPEGEAENSPVDFWQQINDGGREDRAATSSAETSTEESCSESSPEDETPAYYLLDASAVDGGHRGKGEEDADSDNITTLSADVGQRASETACRSSKKYKRTCTHSRLFDFLQHDDGGNDKLQSSSSTGGLDMPSSCTSGYSSAATTPSTSSIGCRGKYEWDSGQMEYDSYYKSWEYACPYFGYDILPSKAFKTIQQRQQGDGDTVQAKPSTTVKFKCPKIPTAENES